MLKAETVFTKATPEWQQEIDRQIEKYGSKFGLITKEDYAAFFATLLAEVGDKASIKSESFNYTVNALIKTFKVFKDNPLLAKKLGRTYLQRAKKERIANYAYANRMGNGPAASGDGWKYRGRGLIQITGKNNYEAVNKEIKDITGADLMLSQHPETAETIIGAVLTALAFWKLHNLSGKSMDEVTDAVNKYTDSREKRNNIYAFLLTKTGESNV